MNLVEKRGKVGLTQKMLAKKAGISQASISSIEGGRTYPHAITRQKIENVLGPVDWIATKLHGGHRHSINLLPENNETLILNQIERFASQFADRIQGYEFILEYTSRAHQKARFMDRVQRYINGEQVKFTANEMQMIFKVKESKSKI